MSGSYAGWAGAVLCCINSLLLLPLLLTPVSHVLLFYLCVPLFLCCCAESRLKLTKPYMMKLLVAVLLAGSAALVLAGEVDTQAVAGRCGNSPTCDTPIGKDPIQTQSCMICTAVHKITMHTVCKRTRGVFCLGLALCMCLSAQPGSPPVLA